jgi:hypothetical protein
MPSDVPVYGYILTGMELKAQVCQKLFWAFLNQRSLPKNNRKCFVFVPPTPDLEIVRYVSGNLPF